MPPKKKKAAAKTAHKNPSSMKFVICPFTDQKVFIQRATLKDLKSPLTYSSGGKKRLWMLASSQQRHEHYANAAQAIARVEQSLLPSLNGRSWEVTCKLSESNGGSVLFRTWKGSMELAVLPHLIEKIPDPPIWPGRKRMQPDEYESDLDEEDENARQLQDREISTLSSVAWELRLEGYAVPTVTVKWKSPDHVIFHSRTKAWEHAQQMAKREVQIHKVLLGIGASGKLLQPSYPSAPTALQVGTLRFQRDGLWVVGQELAWQEDRPQEMIDELEEQQQEQSQSLPTTGLALFIMTRRELYRQETQDCTTLAQADKELRKLWKTLSEERKAVWNKKARVNAGNDDDGESDGEQEESKHNEEPKPPPLPPKEPKRRKEPKREVTKPRKPKISPQSFYIKTRRHEYRKQRQQESIEHSRMTMFQAETELRQIWKTLTREGKNEWNEKALESEAQLSEVEQLEESSSQQDFINNDNDNDPTPVVGVVEEEKKEEDCLKDESASKSPEKTATVSDSTRNAMQVEDNVVPDSSSVGLKTKTMEDNCQKDAPACKSPEKTATVSESTINAMQVEDNVPDSSSVVLNTKTKEDNCQKVAPASKSPEKTATLSDSTSNAMQVEDNVVPDSSSVVLKTKTKKDNYQKDAPSSKSPEETATVSDSSDTMSVEEKVSDSSTSPKVQKKEGDCVKDAPLKSSEKTTPPGVDNSNTLPVEENALNSSTGQEVIHAEKKDAPQISVATFATMAVDNASEELKCENPEVSTSNISTAATTDSKPDLITSLIACPSEILSASTELTKPKAPRKIALKQPTAQANRRWCLKENQIDLCYAACMEHYENVMRTVKARDLSRELQDGFDVLRERGRGRFDMELPAFDSPGFNFLTCLKKAPWMPIVRKILGEDVVLIHKGCFLSMPGAEAQEYHQDGVHLSTQTQRPCHAINVFVPLIDLASKNGPTEFCLGSHILGHEGYDKDFVEIPKPKAGTPIIFDYRLGHRGLGNSSMSCRPIVYCTYARVADGKEFRDSVNFSRKRYHKIGELVEKPLSREERRNKRKRSIESRKEEQMKKDVEKSEAESAKRQKEEEEESRKEEQMKKDVENSEAEAAKRQKEEEEEKEKLHEVAIAMAIGGNPLVSSSDL